MKLLCDLTGVSSGTAAGGGGGVTMVLILAVSSRMSSVLECLDSSCSPLCEVEGVRLAKWREDDVTRLLIGGREASATGPLGFVKSVFDPRKLRVCDSFLRATVISTFIGASFKICHASTLVIPIRHFSPHIMI